MNKFYLINVLIFVFICLSQNVSAQFTGGSGSGFAYNTALPQQINQSVYNDLSVLAITLPGNNDTLQVNEPFGVSFVLLNNGTYPVLPSHGLFVEVFSNNVSIKQQTVYLSQTLLTNAQVNISLDSLVITDIGDFDVCVEVNGTTFAADSITANNNACINIVFNDPTGLEICDKNTFEIYYNTTTQNLHISGKHKIASISIFDILGKEYYSFVDFNTSPENISIPLNDFKKGIYFVRIHTGSYIHNVKFFKN